MSWIESKLSNAIIKAFDELSGNPSDAMYDARGEFLYDWIDRQKITVGTTGAASGLFGLIPGAGIPATIADLGYLLNRMSYCCWGIGEIKHCKVIGMADFKQILNIWATNSRKSDDVFAVSTSFFAAVNTILELEEDALTDEEDLETMNKIALEYHNRGQSIARAISNVSDFKGSKGLSKKLARKKAVKIGSKLAAKIATKLGTKAASKAATSWIPGIGSAVGAGVNVWIMDGIAQSAIKYYGNPIA